MQGLGQDPGAVVLDGAEERAFEVLDVLPCFFVTTQVPQ
jgi:hypothetical protein